MIYTDNNRKKDFQWFLDNYDNLYQTYGHKVFVIQNEKILSIFDDKNLAIDEASQAYGLGNFIVQECTGDESAYMCYITSWELV